MRLLLLRRGEIGRVGDGCDVTIVVVALRRCALASLSRRGEAQLLEHLGCPDSTITCTTLRTDQHFIDSRLESRLWLTSAMTPQRDPHAHRAAESRARAEGTTMYYETGARAVVTFGRETA